MGTLGTLCSRRIGGVAMPVSESRVFLCHASEDKARILELYRSLRVAGLNPWVDKEDIPPASDWDREIVKTIEAARIVVICFSRHLVSKSGSAVGSGGRNYVQRELDIAFQMSRQTPDTMLLIAIRLDD